MKTYNVITDFILPMAAKSGFVYMKGRLSSDEEEEAYAIAKIPKQEYMKLVESYLMQKEFYFSFLGGWGDFMFSDLKKTRKSISFDEDDYVIHRGEVPDDMSKVKTHPIYEWIVGKSSCDCDMEGG